MFLRGIVLLVSVFVSNNSVADCAKDLLGARYKMTTSDAQGKHKQVDHMILWRNGNQVAHQYTDTRITEVWERIKNTQLRMTRNFDEHKRGIEYEPNEIKMQHDNNAWQLKKQLLSQQLIDSMDLKSSTHKDCDILKTYKKEDTRQQLQLQWLAAQQLVKRFSVESDKQHITWELESVIHDTQKVQQLFISRENYQMTDYSDIGDNESDPFLMKMINLGFVAHSSSGIYDQHGNALQGQHSH